ncbi:Exocyst complex component 8 [Blomia tropicalis]|nr:Exocyst complex component 8 [Blomia tropicalis]
MDNLSFSTHSSAASRQMTNYGNLQQNTMHNRDRLFDPIRYVTDLTSKPSVTLESLLHARKTVQNYADETNTQLKKNVYKNYQLFIDTSKEISYLKKEMSQLYKLLSDENKLLDSMMAISIGGSKVGLTPSEKKEALEKVKEERERKMLQMTKTNINGPLPTKEFKSILDSIEGGAGIIENKQDSLVYFEGEVIELDDQQDYRELNTLYLVLLNDSLIMNTILPYDRNVPKIGGISNPSGNRKYKFQSIIDLETIAVVNVKDRRFPKFEMAFKVLMSATTKVFLTTSSNKKKAWMEAFEIAKKYRRTSSRLHRRDTMIFSPSSEPSNSSMMTCSNTESGYMSAPMVNESKSPSTTYSGAGLNPFEEPELEEDDEADPELPYWLVELPDDLDVYIAQRNFEEAVKLVSRAHEHFFLYPKWSDNQSQADLKLKIDNKISELVEALTSELNVAPDRSLQTGPRASRRAVSLLLRLGKSSLAIRLFLDQRTKLLKHYFKQYKTSDGATLNFMKRMSNLYFSHMAETSKEFLRAFEIDANELGVGALRNFELDNPLDMNSNNKWNRRNSDDVNIDEPNSGHSASPPTISFSHAALACLNTWNYRQFKEEYLELFKRYVFISGISRDIAVECIDIAHHQCTKLRHVIGVDFTFVLSKELKTHIKILIEEIQTQLIDAIVLRSEEPKDSKDFRITKESLQEQVFDSKQKLVKFNTEMAELDINIEDWVHESVDERYDPPKKIYLLQLTANTTAFAKLYLNSLKDLLKLTTHPTTVKQINEVLITGFKKQMVHTSKCLRSRVNGINGNPDLVRLNIAFLLDRLIPVVIGKYCKKLELRSFNDLQMLSKDYAYLKDANSKVTTSFSTSSTPKSGSPFNSPIPTPRARKTTQIHVNGKNNGSEPSSDSGGGGGGGGNGSNNGNWTIGTYL